MQNQVRLFPLLFSVLAAAACLGLSIYLAVIALPGFVRLFSVPGARSKVGERCDAIASARGI